MEAAFYRPAEYQGVCVLDDDGQCAIPPLSIVGRFYGNDWLAGLVRNGTGECGLLEAAEVEATWNSMIATDNATAADRLKNGLLVERGAISAGVTSRTRSLLYLGQPLEGFASSTDRAETQLKLYLRYFEVVEKDLWRHFGVKSTLFRSAYFALWRRGGVEFRFITWLIWQLELLRMQEMDLIFILCTILFVSICIRVHTSSNAYTCAAMAQILLSIPVTAFVYRIVFRIEYFGFLHLCSIFLVLGIGADDNFVLLDAWRQAQTNVPAVEDADETTLRRLLYAFARSMEVIFNTSLTTALAFLCLGLSPILPVWTFGIFAAMVVLCNYVMVLTMIPTCLLICKDSCFGLRLHTAGADSRLPVAKHKSLNLPSTKAFLERGYLSAMTWSPSFVNVPICAWLSPAASSRLASSSVIGRCISKCRENRKNSSQRSTCSQAYYMTWKLITRLAPMTRTVTSYTRSASAIWVRRITTNTNQTISEATPSGMVALTCTLRPPGQRSKSFATLFVLRRAVSTSVPWGFSTCLKVPYAFTRSLKRGRCCAVCTRNPW